MSSAVDSRSSRRKSLSRSRSTSAEGVAEVLSSASSSSSSSSNLHVGRAADRQHRSLSRSYARSRSKERRQSSASRRSKSRSRSRSKERKIRNHKQDGELDRKLSQDHQRENLSRFRTAAATGSCPGGGAKRTEDSHGLLGSLNDEERKALHRFLEQPLNDVRLCYRGSEHGFELCDFWRHCQDVSNALFLLKVAGRDNICGAFTKATLEEWTVGCGGMSSYGKGRGLRTFLFSLRNQHQRPVKLVLKDDRYAPMVMMENFGPTWGGGHSHDLSLWYDKQPVNMGGGCATDPDSYRLDEEAERKAGLPNISFAYDRTLLAGDDGLGGNTDEMLGFDVEEIEVWQMPLK